ncbi:MAG: hypothetical protein A2V64_09225 [Bacteroidetes bacterium RBG_13_43_22]|nr:MAG: hypothetical protein A2V64_09225 [Bacteroidetes bacterium RBG_13_43_22]
MRIRAPLALALTPALIMWAQLGSSRKLSGQRSPDYECYYLVSTSLYRNVSIFSIWEICFEDVPVFDLCPYWEVLIKTMKGAASVFDKSGKEDAYSISVKYKL